MTTALHNSQLRVEFDPRKRKQVDEAKQRYIQARREGRAILRANDGVPVNSFADVGDGFIIAEAEVGEGCLAMHFIDDSGDQRIIWDLRDKKQVAEAAKKFNEYVAKGWKPYAIDRKGKRGRRIFGFDAHEEEVIFEDKTTKEKLVDFVKKFAEVKVLPRTYPG